MAVFALDFRGHFRYACFINPRTKEEDEVEPFWKTDQFSAILTQPWYEKQEMVEEARAYGYEASEALLDDWIKKGLVGHAERAGLGRGRGSVAWWPSAQWTLFVECLKARQFGKLRIGQLCAFPAWRWVYWRELGGVALPQVKRAMETWIASVKSTSTEREHKEVRKGVEKLQGRGASGKLALINELTDIWSSQKEPDPDLLRYLLEPVVTDSPLRVTLATGETRSSDIEMLAALYPLRLKAFRQYEQIAALPDAVWEWARTFLLFLQYQGQRVQPVLARNQRLAERYRRLTTYDVLFGCCYDLLTPLSLAAFQQLPDKPKHDHLPFLSHQSWQAGEATARVNTTLVASQLLLPGGDPLTYLRNEVDIAYQEHLYSFTLDLPFL